eukprot:COSAG02_NODE_1982_length_10196_cov_6.214816_5_plen_44_part_00
MRTIALHWRASLGPTEPADAFWGSGKMAAGKIIMLGTLLIVAG